MQQPSSATLNHTSGLSWQARNNSVGDGDDNSDGDSRDVEPNDQSSSDSIGRLIHEGKRGISMNSSPDTSNANSLSSPIATEPDDHMTGLDSIGRLIHEGKRGISMNSSPDTSNANSLSSPIATEPDDHMTGLEGTDMIVHEGFGNIAVGSAPSALGNHENEPNPAELKLANQIVELKLENASLRSHVEQLEHSHSENSFLKSQIGQQQKEFQQLKQVSAKLQFGVCKRDMLNEHQRTKIVQLGTQRDQLQLHCDKLNERMETLKRERQLAQEKSAELETELDKRKEENMRQKDAIKQLTLAFEESKESAKKLNERTEIFERGHQLAQERSAELQTELDKRNEENMMQIDAIKQLTLAFEESKESAKKYLEIISILEKTQESLLNQNHELHLLWEMTKTELKESRKRIQQEMPDEGVYENQMTNQRNSPYSLRAESSEVPYIINFKFEFKLSAKIELFIKDAAMDCYYAVFPAHVILKSNCFGDEENVSSLLPPQGTEMSIEFPSKKLRIVDENPKFLLGRKKHLHRKLVIDIAAANVTQQKSMLPQLVKSGNGELFWPMKILQLDEYAINFLIREGVAVYLKGKSEVGYICHRNGRDLDGLLWVIFEKNVFCAGDCGTIMYVKDKDNNPYMLSMLLVKYDCEPVYGTAILWYNIQELCKEMNIIRPTALNDDEIFVPCDKKLLDSLQMYEFN